MSIPIHKPCVFLRCRKCSRKTEHVLVNTAAIIKGAIEENYECQQCGETKRIYEFVSPYVDSLMQYSVKEGLKEPRKKDYVKVTIRKRKHGFF